MESEELLEEVESTETVEERTEASSSTDPKNIVIKEMTRIVNTYREKMFAKNDDEALINGMNTKTEIINVINHIMNKLTEKRIIGGADEITYEYIHEYYVDNFTEVADNWSKYIRGGVPAQKGPKEQAKEEAKAKVSEELKEKYYQEALENAKREAERKAMEDIKKAEEKRKQKERQAKEAKRKAEEQAEGQTTLFDFI